MKYTEEKSLNKIEQSITELWDTSQEVQYTLDSSPKSRGKTEKYLTKWLKDF